MIKSKRNFLKYISLGLIGLPFFKGVRANYKPKVVIVGGGFGGGSCVRFLEKHLDKVDIILIEKKKYYYTCPFSNYVIGGFKKLDDIKFNYKNLRNRNIKIINDQANFINYEKKQIIFDEFKLNYDYLILSTGIGFKWNSIDGFSKKLSNIFPVSWNGGTDSLKLFKQIDSLENKCKLLIIPPDYPYRCPPAPYERASLIADFLKKKNINFKILILDKKDSFTKSDLFFKAWEELYPDNIEWIQRNKGGEVDYFDSKNKTIYLKSGERIKADFINIIPDQKASDLIEKSNITNGDWCKINPTTFELEGHNNIYVIGDSIDAWDMPKSAFSANSQAKICSENLINKIINKPYKNPIFMNTCYSLAKENYGFAISAWFRASSNNDRIVSLGSKSSPLNPSGNLREQESIESVMWYNSITDEIFGT